MRHLLAVMTLLSFLLVEALPYPAHGATITGTLKAKASLAHCARSQKAYWSFEVESLPHIPCRPRLTGYLVTLDLWQVKGAPTTRSHALKLSGFAFSPDLLVIPKDSQAYEVTVTNEDRFAHKIFSPASKELGRELISPNESRTLKFEGLSPLPEGQVQVFPMRCERFPHMLGAVVFVRSTAYDVVDPHGRFRIKNVPKGTYTLRVFRFGQQVSEQKVTVGRKPVNIDIDLLPKTAAPRKDAKAAAKTDPKDASKEKGAEPAKTKRRKRRRRRRR